jgi:hypothetical protein
MVAVLADDEDPVAFTATGSDFALFLGVLTISVAFSFWNRKRPGRR